jgi:hypothetical protein
MKANKRLYEMGGDIITDNFFTSSNQEAMIGDKRKKKKKIKSGTGQFIKKGQYSSGCTSKGCR